MVLPVQRFSPAPGITISRSGKHVDITGWMELWGPEATSVRAAAVQQSINGTWTQNFDDGYSTKCAISVRYYRASGGAHPAATQIEALKMLAPSNVVMRGPGPRRMQLNANEHDAFTWTPAHEFGHILGLNDRYTESVVSRRQGALGGQRTTTVQKGYEGNLMAVANGKLAGKNIADLAMENQPDDSDEDDQIRAWVLTHKLPQIAVIPAAEKLRMIKILMDGWFSEDDTTAVIKICAAVTTKAAGDLIRSGVGVHHLSRLGQQGAVRQALIDMAH